MKNNFIGEAIISISLIGVTIFYIKPMYLLMPHMMHTFMLPLLIILFLILVGLVWKETPGDEREQLHKFIATRFAYIAGITILFIGICVETFSDRLDLWLVIALCVILLSKFIGLVYAYLTH